MPESLSPEQVAQAGSLCEVFQRTVAAYPDEVALRTPDDAVSLTWRQYDKRVRRIAAGLAAAGVGRGDAVGLMLTNRPEFHLVDAAVMHLGAVSFSVYNTYPADQVAHLFSVAGNKVVICEEQFLGLVRAAGERAGVQTVICVDTPREGAGQQATSRQATVSLAELELKAGPGFDFDSAWRAVTRDDLLTLIFTSGTTGAPKGVELTHANMLFSLGSNATTMVRLFGENSRGAMLSYLPDANLANRWSAHYGPMVTGSSVTSVRDGKTVLAVMRQVHPTGFMGVPMIWYKLKAQIEQSVAAGPAFRRALTAWALRAGAAAVRAEVAGKGLPLPGRLRLAAADRLVLGPLRAGFGIDQFGITTSGGAPIAPEALEFYMALGVPLCEVFGMTESCAAGLANMPGARRPGTVGKPRPGVEITLAGDGELLLRSGGVMRGYRNDKERTAEAVDGDGWLHTGDVASIDAEGYVRIVDRKKDLIINSSGKNMSPAHIENSVKIDCPLIGSIVAIGDGRPHVTALITLDPEQARAFAAARGIADASPAALAGDPRVRAAVAAGVTKGNTRLPRVEQVRDFTILPVFLEANGDELTVTMKVRRKVVYEKYAAEIDGLYRAAAAEPRR